METWFTTYMTTTQHNVSISTATNPRRQVELFEGPSAKQVAKMRRTMTDLKARAQVALTAGNDDQAFALDCLAFDIECTLRDYGYTV